MIDNPVSWVVLGILALVIGIKCFLTYVNSKQAATPAKFEKDEDLIFFD